MIGIDGPEYRRALRKQGMAPARASSLLLPVVTFLFDAALAPPWVPLKNATDRWLCG